MSKFNQSSGSNSKVVNYAGGNAFSMSKEMELVHAVLTTFLKDKFYESGEDRADRIKELVRANKPEFVANLAAIARKEFHLRSVTHLLVGELAKSHRGDDLVSRLIDQVAERPDDLTEICAYVGKPLPKQVKRGVRHALLKFSRYQLAKYRGDKKDWSLVDLFNLVHPNAKFASADQKKAWKDLINGKLKSEDTWESEVSEKATAKTWEKLILENKMGYMALLRNLNNFTKYDIKDKALDQVIDVLTDEKRIRTSKQLPFRFYTAYKNVTGNRRLSDAISEAMDVAVDNAPTFKGKTLIAIDCSGSMSGDPIEKAAIFGAILMKNNSRADVILYDTSLKEFVSSTRTPVVDIADKIVHEAMGGGTQTSLVFDYSTVKKNKYDRIVIISDNESWNEGSVQEHYLHYRKTVGADPYVYAIDIEGYGTTDVKGAKVRHLTGWSERIFDFMEWSEKGESIVDYIKSFSLSSEV